MSAPDRDTAPVVLFAAGYGNSGAEHWQRRWHASMPGSIWIEQRDWLAPERDAWVEAIARAVADARGPVVFVAHSLGCLAVESWARGSAAAASVRGALFVAPPNPAGAAFPREIHGFSQPGSQPLPFASVLVASSDDPYATPEWTRVLGAAWATRLVEVGPRGHINAGSGLGDWPAGRDWLQHLIAARSA